MTTEVLPHPEKIRFVARSYAMPVGPSQGASGHEARTFIALTSITWMVLLPSLLTKIFPFPSLAAPSGALSSSATVPTMSPVLASDRDDGSDRTTVIREHDAVREVIVHDAV